MKTDRDIEQQMLDYLPKYYQESVIGTNVILQEAEEIKGLNEEISEVLQQFFIETATWGLQHWERICDLVTDESKSYEERRSVIQSKLRGIGTVTAALIKEVAESYGHGEVAVEEVPQEYSIDITFIGELGIPTNLEDIQQALAEIIPAHLGIEYVFTYMTWDDLDSYRLTWNELDSKNITWDLLETYRE
ncbi:YmfQ family protein [Chengkuizengella axinellae]|uniref:YmfQ family protein n=1 Tax=Chengkuizengella axinellae TaxID=3064388 RepID=A0ABT9J280_9BACL|nr:YmfQ family protein [Chengkuizengella sp. 2205SS18-9]MDP5275697.1 YmfQ family protein [Chengkuizengella sp. 2205SS18-9]